jgi:hypothetical protein
MNQYSHLFNVKIIFNIGLSTHLYNISLNKRISKQEFVKTYATHAVEAELLHLFITD